MQGGGSHLGGQVGEMYLVWARAGLGQASKEGCVCIDRGFWKIFVFNFCVCLVS